MKAEYDIKTLDLLAGNLPNRAHVLVLEWASKYRDKLLENWKKSQIPTQLERIEPLD